MNEHSSRCPGCFEPIGKLRICSQCGYDRGTERSPLFLPHGHRLADQYELGRVLGQPGGFGITYLAWDLNLQTRVAIKEYLPKKIASRATDQHRVEVRAPEQAERFARGREEFLAEARIVARFNHPNVMRVRNFFRANDTAYLVMDYYEGMSLDDYLKDNENDIQPETAIGIIRQILSGLQVVHDAGCLHRDVKPGNIYLTSVGRPILLDFGAARVSDELNPDDAVVLVSEGYAPPEQYRADGNQGPWTDVYAAAATLYRLLVGDVPPPARERAQADIVQELPTLARIDQDLADAIARAMALDVAQRTPTASDFANELAHAEPAPRADTAISPKAAPAPPAAAPTSSDRPWWSRLLERSAAAPWPVLLATACVLVLLWPLIQPEALPRQQLTPVAPAPDWSAREQRARARQADRHAAHTRLQSLLPRVRRVPAGEVQVAAERRTLPAFGLATRAVSVGEFRRFVEDSGYHNPAWDEGGCESPGRSVLATWEAPGHIQDDHDPVVCVDRHDADAFVRWLRRRSDRPWRLPTLAEWLRAQALDTRTRIPAEVWSCSDQAWQCQVANTDHVVLTLSRQGEQERWAGARSAARGILLAESF